MPYKIFDGVRLLFILNIYHYFDINIIFSLGQKRNTRMLLMIFT